MNSNYQPVCNKLTSSTTNSYSTPQHISNYRFSEQYVIENKKFFLQLPAMYKYQNQFFFVSTSLTMSTDVSEITDIVDDQYKGCDSICIGMIQENDKVANNINIDDFIKNAELLIDLTYDDRVAIFKSFKETHIINNVRASARNEIINKVAKYNGFEQHDLSLYEHQIKKDLYFTKYDDDERKIVKIGTRADNVNFFDWDTVSTEDLVECSHDSWTYDPKSELPYELREIEFLFNEMMDEIEANNDYYLIQPENHMDVIEIIKENEYYRDKYSSLLSHPNRLKIVFAKVIDTKWKESLGILYQ